MEDTDRVHEDSPTPDHADLHALELSNGILEIGLAAHESADLTEVVSRLVALILRETSYPYVGVALVDDDGRHVRRFMGMDHTGEVTFEGIALPLGQGVVGHVVQAGQSVLIDDVRNDSRYVAYHGDSRAELCVPLRLHDHVVGALNLESPEVGRFDESDRALIEALSTPVAQAIHTARSVLAVRRLNERLDLLNHVSRIITGTSDMDELLQAVVSAVRQRMGYALVALGLVDDAQRLISLRAWEACWPIDLEVGHIATMGEGVVGRALAGRAGLLVPDVRQFPGYVPAHPDVRCEMCCPLRLGELIVGYLDAESTTAHDFDDDDLALLQTIADHIAQAVATARHEMQLRQLREDLSAMIVHDLRGPLTVAMTAIDLAGEYMGAPDQAAQHTAEVQVLLSRASGAGDELMVLIDGLLQIQKLETGAWPIERQRCDVVDLARRVVERMEVVARTQGIDLNLITAASLPEAEIDHGLLVRVLDNLLLNAFKVAGRQGRVTVEVRRAGPRDLARWHRHDDALVFSVYDDGPGIPAAYHRRVFDKFAIVEDGKATGRRSTGLGLAFCRLAILEHDGEIWVDDLPAGAQISSLVPLASAPPPAR